MKKSYTRELKGKDWELCLDKSFKKNVKNAKVDGFRKGQVTKDLYIKKFGLESLFMDAIDEALPVLFDELLKEKDVVVPACTPTIDIKKVDKECLEVEFTIVGTPEVKLGKYKDLGVKKDKVTVSKDEVDHEIEHLREQFAELKLTDGKIKEGHIAVIDFEGFKDDVAFEGGKASNYSLTIGSGTFIPGFEEGLVGLVTGDEKELKLQFPENYQVEDLKGKDVMFKVKVNEVKERVLPELNEDFFKDLGMESVDTEEKLRKEIEDNLKVSKEREAEEAYIIKTLETAISNAKFELPEEIVNDELDRIYKEFSSRLSMQGLDIENYLSVMKTTEEDLKKQMRPEAEKRVSYRLVVDEVAKKEKIEITKEEVENNIEKAIAKYNVTKEELLKSIGGVESLEYDMKMKKALEIITGIKKEEEE